MGVISVTMGGRRGLTIGDNEPAHKAAGCVYFVGKTTGFGVVKLLAAARRAAPPDEGRIRGASGTPILDTKHWEEEHVASPF